MAEEQDVDYLTQGMKSRIGPIEIDWPRTIGYYAGVGLALAFEVIEPPLGIFIAAIPLLKMLNHPGNPQPARFVGQVLEGAAAPVGGGAQATIELTKTKGLTAQRLTILGEARQLANQARNKRSGKS